MTCRHKIHLGSNWRRTVGCSICTDATAYRSHSGFFETVCGSKFVMLSGGCAYVRARARVVFKICWWFEMGLEQTNDSGQSMLVSASQGLAKCVRPVMLFFCSGERTLFGQIIGMCFYSTSWLICNVIKCFQWVAAALVGVPSRRIHSVCDPVETLSTPMFKVRTRKPVNLLPGVPRP